jgi:shikimate kinase / 3-dehydroquinate synthase
MQTPPPHHAPDGRYRNPWPLGADPPPGAGALRDALARADIAAFAPIGGASHPHGPAGPNGEALTDAATSATLPRTVMLCGFMGTGKSTVGPLLAERLGRPFIDADHVVAARVGLPVAEIFARRGEAAFRAAEREVCRELAEVEAVVAVGGGATVHPADRAALARRAMLVCLEADPATLEARLAGSTGRPLADDGGWRELLAQREPSYRAIGTRVDTVDRRPDEVADAVAARLLAPDAGARRRPVSAPDDEYGLLIGPGLLTAAGRVLREHEVPPGRALVVTDATVAGLHAPSLLASLGAEGWDARVVEVARGEAAKSLAVLEELYDALVDHGVDRDGVVLGLGGGAVGDLAGFAAATYLRGVAYVAVPTTLLAMVDASLGGKTGVNLPRGKNLVGSFTSPRLVLADVATLSTLPPAEWRAGLAEVVKHALIGDPGLLEGLEASPPAGPPGPAGREMEGAAGLVERAAAVKIGVVAEDFRERGRREQLNLGHTFAHGFERASGWRVRHGDAVAVGLVAACRAASAMGLAAPELAARVESLLRSVELPVRLDLDVDEVLAAMAHDKKRRGGRLRLVLPERPGSVVVRPAPEPAVLRRVLDSVLGDG